jgi:uncharacterized protein (DUF1697 family)
VTRYVALLRGINVGGKNLIGMPALKARFEAQGHTDVVSYIQSGNILFSSNEPAAVLVARIEADLSKAFGYDASLVLRSKRHMHGVVNRAPDGFGTRPALYRYDVLFLKPPLSAPEVMELVAIRDGIDQAFAGNGVIYFSRLIRRATQSYLNRLVSMPIYKRMTIRNWNTTTRLLALMGGPGD